MPQSGETAVILVNGVLYEILDHKPTFVKEGSVEHPVLAWRYSSECIRLIGSSKIAVERCVLTVSVWASPEFLGKLYGLCGYYDGNVDNDFTKRDGTISALENYPTGVQFPDSWQTTTCGKGDLSPGLTEVKNCTLEKEVEDRLRSQCIQTVEESGNLSQEMISVLIDNCVLDVCSIYQNTSGNASAVQEWLGGVKTSMEDISDILNKTTDKDILPGILFNDSVVATTVTTELTTSDFPGEGEFDIE
ncbi:uncharacterized protein [Macrobrachium rosenbergii]|uniref:uncharacterized protein n=1 Tax=Macrobrachium rosenbergii TaxID=79674 RepID=UPI0034D5FC90